MVQVMSLERPAGGAAGMWVPRMSPGLMDAGSARAQEIARRREEMMGMLRDLPESEYELSLTDLVEKAGNGERKDDHPELPRPAASGKLAPQQGQQPQTVAPRADRRGHSRRRESGGSLRSSSDGVLLNFYMPRSLTRSFTAPRHSRTPSSVSSGRTTASVASDCCDKRESDANADTVKCWSLPWDRPWRKCGRRGPAAPPRDNLRAAILRAAEHSDSSAKV